MVISRETAKLVLTLLPSRLQQEVGHGWCGVVVRLRSLDASLGRERFRGNTGPCTLAPWPWFALAL
jgi:hypothetical protein